MKNNKVLYGEEDTINLKVLIGLSRATQAVHKRSAEIFKKGGLTIGQFAVLEALYHKGSLTIAQIIESILSTGGNITVVVNNLEREQLVERHINPQDKRSNLISITEKGKKLIEEIFPHHIVDLEECFDVFLVEEKRMLMSLLKKIRY